MWLNIPNSTATQLSTKTAPQFQIIKKREWLKKPVLTFKSAHISHHDDVHKKQDLIIVSLFVTTCE